MSSAMAASDERDWWPNAAVVGSVDLGIVVALILFGRMSHDQSIFAEPLTTIDSVLPFVVGWTVVALLAGLYRRPVPSSPIDAARDATVCWLGAANVGFLLRGSPVFDGGVAWSFTVVLTGIGLVAIVGWRVAYIALGVRSTRSVT